MRIRRAPCVIAAVALSCLAGCHELTQVVLVFDSDLSSPDEVDQVGVTVGRGPAAPQVAPGRNLSTFAVFPLSLGVVADVTPNFSFTVQLFTRTSDGLPILTFSRTVTDVRFVHDETRMFVMHLSRDCACDGTSCPLPGNPACDNLRNPTLEPFDPNVAPPSTMMRVPGNIFF